MPGSSMGKSVLLLDEASGQKQLNSLKSGNGEPETVLNMDLMQRQQMQKSLIINQEVNFTALILRILILDFFKKIFSKIKRKAF